MDHKQSKMMSTRGSPGEKEENKTKHHVPLLLLRWHRGGVLGGPREQRRALHGGHGGLGCHEARGLPGNRRGFREPRVFFVGKRPLKQVFPPYFPGGTNGIPGVDPGMVVLSDCFAKTTCNVLKQNRVMMPLHVCPKRGRPPRFCGALKGRKEPTTHHVDLICWQQPACWQMLLPGVSRVYGI